MLNSATPGGAGSGADGVSTFSVVGSPPVPDVQPLIHMTKLLAASVPAPVAPSFRKSLRDICF